MKIDCQEASEICTKSQYKEASFWQILKLQLHIMRCKVCRAYARNNGKLTSLCHKGDLHVMSSDEKQALKKRLEEKIQ